MCFLGGQVKQFMLIQLRSEFGKKQVLSAIP